MIGTFIPFTCSEFFFSNSCFLSSSSRLESKAFWVFNFRTSSRCSCSCTLRFRSTLIAYCTIFSFPIPLLTAATTKRSNSSRLKSFGPNGIVGISVVVCHYSNESTFSKVIFILISNSPTKRLNKNTAYYLLYFIINYLGNKACLIFESQRKSADLSRQELFYIFSLSS